MPIELKIAVRELVEQVLRAGDLDTAFRGARRSLEAIRAHQKLQSARPVTYAAEVCVSHQVEADGFRLTIDGRIDGVDRLPGHTVVEEIKTTGEDPDHFASEEFEASISPLHWAQARVYAYLYALQEELARIEVRLAYVHLDTGRVREFSRPHTIEDLAFFFEGLVQKYLRWARTLADWRLVRDRSIEGLAFPFADFRPGQRDMAVTVYRSIREGRHLLVQAATGIGKSMGALFPAVKTLIEGSAERIFYLTARTTGKAAAEQALAEMRCRGLRLKSVTLTAKERICFQEQVDCTPEACPYAKGHFDRVNDAIAALFARDDWTRAAVEAAASAHHVCPFELSLDLCLWAECIVCDYNYAFDPRVCLRRFFQESVEADSVFLVDEAHNLVDRAREMFSAAVDKASVLALRRAVRGELPGIHRSLTRINTWLLEARRDLTSEAAWQAASQPPEDLYPRLEHFVRLTDHWLRRNEKTAFREELLEVYFGVTGFLRIAELFNSAYTTLCERTGDDLRVRLYCLDPSLNLERALTRCHSAIFFSATLAPLDYFRQILGCPEAGALVLPSPFPRENFGVFLSDRVSTLYRQREQSAGEVLEAIRELVSAKPGNYLVFFPSYAYMERLSEAFRAACPTVETVVQRIGMGEGRREAFLSRFAEGNSSTLVGFAVMGGVFGEGIDLVGERLSGAVVVGVGLPGICPERELIRQYFADKQGAGFEFAYQFPGINRVLQAAGRVIRSESDRGVVLLVDRRFASARYRSLLPGHWQPVRAATAQTLRTALKGFWQRVRHRGPAGVETGIEARG